MSAHLVAEDAALARARSVYCEGRLLAAVQRARLFDDSKTFVDMPLKRGVSPEAVLAAFDALPGAPAPDRAALGAFVAARFDAPGADLAPWTPPDWAPEPPAALLARVRDGRLRTWARALHAAWPRLGRRTAVRDAACTSLLARAHGLVVPGGRFRETYYWDSLWIVKGLLACGLRATAAGVVDNLLDDVARFGRAPRARRARRAPARTEQRRGRRRGRRRLLQHAAM